MLSKMYLRRSNKVLPVSSRSYETGSEILVASLDANLATLGYALSAELAKHLAGASFDEIREFAGQLVRELKELKGVRTYRPMYPNFPQQVMDASDAELYFNAIMHYLGDAVGLRILPVYEKNKRGVLSYVPDRQVIGLGDFDDFLGLIRNLVSQKSAFSQQDREDLVSLVRGDFTLAIAKVDEITNRENKAFVNGLLLKQWGLGITNDLYRMDTATDVLRLAVALSEGDVSLAENTKFKSFSRAERRLLLSALDRIDNPEEDMARHPQQWKRLGERLHPGEFKNFNNTFRAFKTLRENEKVWTFNAKVEKAFREGDDQGAIALLASRPGEYVRRLGQMIYDDRFNSNLVLNTLSSVARKAAPTVLLQAHNALTPEVKNRVFFPKGSVAKMKVIPETRPVRSALPTLSYARLALVNAILDNFKGRDELGNIYVDESLRHVAVPFGLRNASKQLKTLARGSRLPLDKNFKVLRFFIWWKDAEYRTDIDLSALLLDENFNHVTDIAYYNLRGGGAYHSGDITSAPNGASEFIDIEIEKFRKQGRYVVMSLNSFTHQPFKDLPECFAGFMGRADLQSGEVYDPRTVVNKVDVASDRTQAVPFIFDLETGQAIWVDLAQGGHSINNVAASQGGLVSVAEALVNLTPPNLYDLFTLHGIARGNIVNNREDADIVYAFDGDITPFDTEKILAEYL